MTSPRVVPNTALRATAGGEALGYTGRAPVSPNYTGRVESADGHDWHEITAWVRADRLRSTPPPPPMSFEFRYVPQLGPLSDPNAPEHSNRSECGLASMAMALSIQGIVTERIDRLSDKYDREDDGTSARDLVRMAADYGAKFVVRTYRDLIPEPWTICLGEYLFQDRSKLDLPSFRGRHWVLFRQQLPDGSVVIADPLYRTAERGASVVWPLKEWARYFTPYGRGLRVGVTPDTRNWVSRMLGGGDSDVPEELLNLRSQKPRE